MLQVAWQVGSDRDSVHRMADRLCSERRQLDSAFIPNKEGSMRQTPHGATYQALQSIPDYFTTRSFAFCVSAI